jgi:TolA-binding protein
MLLNLRLMMLAALAAGTLAAQKKEDFQALQRDVALVQADVAALKRSLEGKLDGLTQLIQQSMDSSAKTTAAVNDLEKRVTQQLTDQQKAFAAPVAEVGAKVNTLADEFQFVRESVAGMDGRLSKLSAQMVDLNNTVQALAAPPPPPLAPVDAGAVPAAIPAPAASVPKAQGPPPGISADTLYNDARRDMSTGKNDIAMQEFQDYLKWFPSTDYAPNAQFYIGNIHFNVMNYPEALKAFDLVLSAYPETSNKNADAMYMRGRTLVLMGEKKAAAEEYAEFLVKYPKHQLTPKVESELKALPPPAPAARKRR